MTIDPKMETETSDFWVGTFPDEDTYWEYFGESVDHYSSLGDAPAMVTVPLRGAAPNETHKARTQFLEDHNQIDYYNNGVSEQGFNADAKSIAELIEPYSYSNQYCRELTRLVDQLGITGINTFIFVGTGEIQEPRSIRTVNYQLHYLGKITYSIEN